jgi:hypothetical protein
VALGALLGFGAARWVLGEHIAFLEDEVRDYKDKLHDASPSQAARTIQDLQAKVNGLSKQMQAQGNRLDLTDDQQKKLLTELDHVPPDQTYYVETEVISDCAECKIYENNLTSGWGNLPGWHVTGSVNPQLYPIIGILIPSNSTRCPERAIKLIMNALTAAQIPFTSCSAPEALKNLPVGHCAVVVGAPR